MIFANIKQKIREIYIKGISPSKIYEMARNIAEYHPNSKIASESILETIRIYEDNVVKIKHTKTKWRLLGWTKNICVTWAGETVFEVNGQDLLCYRRGLEWMTRLYDFNKQILDEAEKKKKKLLPQ